jgi:DDE superfamily endonuclease/Helix-turn-helix of DDE superfamily endonuclease
MYTYSIINKKMFKIMEIDKVLANPRLCYAILGVGKREFDKLLPVFTKIWFEYLNNKKRKRIVGGGSIGNIKDPKKKLFFILWYSKIYPTFDLAAYVFASSKSRTHSWTHILMPLLEKALGKKLVLPKRRVSSEAEFYAMCDGIKELMIDGVERPCVRRKKSKMQTKNYSGKKKRPTRKNIIITNSKKFIKYLSPTKNGKLHDKRHIDKTNNIPQIPKDITLLADTGFQGVQHEHPNILMPKKKSKKNPLTDFDKQLNHLISSVRVGVEHAISGMKRFGIAANIFRGRRGQDDRFMNVSAGLYNLRLQM